MINESQMEIDWKIFNCVKNKNFAVAKIIHEYELFQPS